MSLTLTSYQLGGRTAIIAPMKADMTGDSEGKIGVALEQQVAFAGIHAAFEAVFDEAASIKLLQCFTVEEKNTGLGTNDNPVDQAPLLDVTLESGKEADFKASLVALFNNAIAKAQWAPSGSVGQKVEDLFQDAMVESIKTALKGNDFLDILEASNPMAVAVTLQKEAGATSMYGKISASGATTAAKRRLFLTQIPLPTLNGYLVLEADKANYLPLKAGDSMTFVFDIDVEAPDTLLAVGKDATATEGGVAGVEGTTLEAGITEPSSSALYGATYTLDIPNIKKRVAFIAHLTEKSAFFVRKFTDAQKVSMKETVSNAFAAKTMLQDAVGLDVDGVILDKVQPYALQLSTGSIAEPNAQAKNIAGAHLKATVLYGAEASLDAARELWVVGDELPEVIAMEASLSGELRACDAEIVLRTAAITGAVSAKTAADADAAAKLNASNLYDGAEAAASIAWANADDANTTMISNLTDYIATLSQELATFVTIANDIETSKTNMSSISGEVDTKLAALVAAKSAYMADASDSNLNAEKAAMTAYCEAVRAHEYAKSLVAQEVSVDATVVTLTTELAGYVTDKTGLESNAYSTYANFAAYRVAYAGNSALLAAYNAAALAAANAENAVTRANVLKTSAIEKKTTLQTVYGPANDALTARLGLEAAWVVARAAHTASLLSVAGLNESVTINDVIIHGVPDVLATVRANWQAAAAAYKVEKYVKDMFGAESGVYTAVNAVVGSHAQPFKVGSV